MNRLAFDGALVVLVVILLLSALGLSPHARWLPLLILVPTLVLVLWQSWCDYRAYRRPASPVRGETAAMMWVLSCPVAIVAFGFLLAVPAYCLVYARRYAGESWAYAVGVAGASGAMIWLGLEGFLQIELYGGLLWKWIG
jgi:hypothetical protein